MRWQTSGDLASWTPLTTVTLDSAGSSTYLLSPTQTAYYRAYFYSNSSYGDPFEIIVTPAPSSQLPNAPASGVPPRATPTIGTVTWGQSVVITDNGTPGNAIEFESSIDNVVWIPLGSAVVDSVGVASLTFRPQTNLLLRATATGQDPSPAGREIVRQVVSLSPTNSGKTKIVRRGTTIVFKMTIRPQTGALAEARYRVYRWTGSAWSLLTELRRHADATGVARLAWTFTSPGHWYVRAMADPTTSNANSAWSQVERYDVP